MPGAGNEVAYAITRYTVAEGSFVKSGIEVSGWSLIVRLKLRALVPERYTGEVRLGQKADVSTTEYSRPVLRDCDANQSGRRSRDADL